MEEVRKGGQRAGEGEKWDKGEGQGGRGAWRGAGVWVRGADEEGAEFDAQHVSHHKVDEGGTNVGRAERV